MQRLRKLRLSFLRIDQSWHRLARFFDPSVLQSLHLFECDITMFDSILESTYQFCHNTALQTFEFVNDDTDIDTPTALERLSEFLASFEGLKHLTVILPYYQGRLRRRLREDSIICHAATLESLRLENVVTGGTYELFAHQHICKSCLRLEYIGLPMPIPELFGDVRDGWFGAYPIRDWDPFHYAAQD